eukprot:COSAG01_NODE_3349_length_6224_cov_19.144653_3_plen_173_part_00
MANVWGRLTSAIRRRKAVQRGGTHPAPDSWALGGRGAGRGARWAPSVCARYLWWRETFRGVAQVIRDGIPSLPMAAAPVSAPHRLAWLVAACGLGAHSSSCLEWAKRRVDQTLEEAPIASRHAATLPLRPSAHVPAAVVGPDLPHSLAHDREPSVDSPCARRAASAKKRRVD